MKVTSLELEQDGGRIVATFDTGLRLSLGPETAASLRVGQVVDKKTLTGLRTDDRFHRALETALRFLEYRARSEGEVRQRLRRGGYSSRTADRVVAELRRRRLVDDTSFARSWCESRASSSPRGRRVVLGELLARGVGRETAEAAVANIDDEAAAYEAGRKKLRLLAGLDYNAFRVKLGGYLRRRGFDYDVINRAVRRLWDELSS